MSLPRLLIVVALTTSACFIGGPAYQNAVCKLDEDGDGDPKCGLSNTVSDGDCDDSNPDVNTRRDETGEMDADGNVIGGAYDGYDNDCEGGDLLDVDGDEYAGISRDAYEALDREAWPQGQKEQVDCLDLPPVLQEAAFGVTYDEGIESTVNPEQGETWYDGLDGNCNGDNDFDEDGDGVATVAVPDWYPAYLEFYGLPAMEATDCNDSDADIGPGSTVPETWYDGEDQDCAGDNDFDPDGDNHLTPGVEDELKEYVQKYGYEEQPWATLPWTADADCMDLNDTFDGVEVDAAMAAATQLRLVDGAVCPDGEAPSAGGSCETDFANGFDDACDDVIGGVVVHNDFDQDGDGFMPSGRRQDFIDYVLRYIAFENVRGDAPYASAFTRAYGATETEIGAYYDVWENDCDDADPGIHPDAIEVLADAVDQDCDGSVDGAPFDFGTLTWYDPGPPRLARTDDHFVLVSAATTGIDADDGFGIRKRRLVALSWPRDPAGTTQATVDASPYSVSNPDRNVLHPQVGLVGASSSYYVGASWNDPRTRLQVTKMDRDVVTAANYLVRQQSYYDERLTEHGYAETDLRCGTSECWQVSCDGDSAHFVRFDKSNTLTARTLDFVDSIDATDCFVVPGLYNDGTDIFGTVAADGTVSAWQVEFGVAVAATVDPFEGQLFSLARGHEDLLLQGLPTGGFNAWSGATTFETLLTGIRLADVDAVDIDGTWYIAALADDGTVVLAYGPADSLTEVTLPVSAPGGDVTVSSVAIEADEGRAVVAVRGVDAGGTDVVGWSVISAPE